MVFGFADGTIRKGAIDYRAGSNITDISDIISDAFDGAESKTLTGLALENSECNDELKLSKISIIKNDAPTDSEYKNQSSSKA